MLDLSVSFISFFFQISLYSVKRLCQEITVISACFYENSKVMIWQNIYGKDQEAILL